MGQTHLLKEHLRLFLKNKIQEDRVLLFYVVAISGNQILKHDTTAIAQERIKYLGGNLTKHVKNQYEENYKC